MTNTARRGQYMALFAAILGWLFDGFEMGLFPLVMKPALEELLAGSTAALDEAGLKALIGKWEGIMHAGFLVGAATGGVLFGWLGDRIGRVRAMSLSVFTYAIFSGLCGLGSSAELVLFFRFVAALGMGGEWALGVSLVMELWPGTSRAWLAGMIGAAANVGFMLIAAISLAMAPFVQSIGKLFLSLGLPEAQVTMLTQNQGWRLLLVIGAAPALLTFFIRLLVPESKKWQEEHDKGATAGWSAKDLWGVAIGCLGPLTMIYIYAIDLPAWVQGTAVVLGVSLALVGYTHPVRKFMSRSGEETTWSVPRPEVLRRMYLGAALSGIALLATWGAVQRGPSWANDLVKASWQGDPEALGRAQIEARAWTQIASALGAVLGTFIGALLGERLGRRVTYCGMCILALGSLLLFFRGNNSYGTQFLITSGVAGLMTASFYGWLPLYLPELFPTRVRAIGQGFSYNFGRVLAGAGSLYIGSLIKYYGGYPQACSMLAFVYLLGLVVIWFGPETKDQPLPE